MKRILIVDDVTDTRSFLGTVLMSNGYSVSVARNGKEGVKLARDHMPHLIILDVMLPDVNGKDLIPLFRKNDENVIIVMLTAYGSLDNALECGKAGANKYLQKSTQFNDLFTLIDEYLKHEDATVNAECTLDSSTGINKSPFIHSTNRKQIVEPLKVGIEREMDSKLKMALAAAGGNKSKAAHILQISRASIYRLINKLENDDQQRK